MEISTLESGEREALLDLLDLWPVPDGWSGRDFFRRYLEDDPSFVDENVWVAREGKALVGCVQIFPRPILLLGHTVPMGGIGSVFTHPDHRREGVSSALLERASEAMCARGFELSILFSGLHDFYARFGWRPLTLHRSILQRADVPIGMAQDESIDIEMGRFERDKDLEAVQALHASYSGQRDGTVVRDGTLWDASLAVAGNPGEEFLVARRAGQVVAYARATLLHHALCVTELGRAEDASGPQASLIASLLETRDPDELAPEGTTSAELRSSLVLPSFDDIALAVALEHRGVKLHPLEFTNTMLRCLDVDALAERLDVQILPDEDGPAFLERILPPDGLVYWPADRF